MQVRKKSHFSGVKLSLLSLSLLASYSVAADDLTGLSEADAPVKYLVKFKDDTSSISSRISDFSQFSGSRIAQASLLQRADATDIEQLGKSSIYSVELDGDNVASLEDSIDVEYVEVDHPRFLMSDFSPWGQTTVAANLLSDVNAGNQTICIIDSGYDIAHNDLSGNVVNGTDDARSGQWDIPGANNSHGTHVAGTIAAVANDSGLVGVLPNGNVNLHIVKVFKDGKWAYSSDLVRAVQTCVDNGAKVINMSLGGKSPSRTEESSFARHHNNGVLLIAAAGNKGTSEKSYPASYDSVMSVAATDSTNRHANFSQFNPQVEISAPGEAVLSTVSVGEGVLADISVSGKSLFDRGVVPHHRLVRVDEKYQSSRIAGAVTAELAVCDTASGQFDCGDMRGKVCLVERIGNQKGKVRPEVDAVEACFNADAEAAIVYSNQQRPGLQNPFVTDDNDQFPLISVSVDRDLGKALALNVGDQVTVRVTKGGDYAYYNGTSMATPHVVGVAGLVWSYNDTCTAKDVRKALAQTAKDIGAKGRDNRTGFGLVDAVAAKNYLVDGCNGGDDSGDTGNPQCDATGINVYPDWTRNDWRGNPNHAQTGDKMVYNGAIYQAKWWTRAAPGSNSSWTHICNL
ncbi:peptidase S8 [Veronia nyctiphanis]|uniref:Peptidase S8 n=1 Tax=Veronia nyctiphanis TaxID=1278244 RepID=A0A4Q0YS11_9GAMM|nr:S8 family serine peptidase [Veronia nyctiphanis]RXJ73962.1 peptidase S8 [Veronia nyctiphanis]